MPTACECSGHITRVSQRLNQFQSSATAAIVLRTATLTFYCWVLTRTRAGDQGTRGGSLNATKAGIDDALRLSEMLKLTGADGFFATQSLPQTQPCSSSTTTHFLPAIQWQSSQSKVARQAR
jgi:hypothetical protein